MTAVQSRSGFAYIPHVALPHSVLLEAMQVLLLLLAKGVRPPLEVISAQTLPLRVN